MKRFSFIYQAITAGLAVAFVIIVLRPDLLTRQSIVEIKESGPVKITVQSVPEENPDYTLSTHSFAGAVAQATPAVVNIYTTKMTTQRPNPLLEEPLFKYFFGDGFSSPRQRLETNLGSGVIISEQGYILTNNHVIEGADEIQVALKDGRHIEATVVGTDPDTDLAVLRVQLPDLPSITIGRSAALQVGDVVLAIGNPFGVGQTVTLGIVSATGRNQLGINTFEDFIQTDAAINPGNSGGALINARGHLVGINTAIFSRSGGSQGIGFAIPVKLAKGVMQQIIERGRVVRGWLGIEIQAITPELAESFGWSQAKGVIIAGILRQGPADQAGLKPGDIITHINGAPVSGNNQVLVLITNTEPGRSIELSLVRRGESLVLTARVEQRPQRVRPDRR